MNHNDFKTELDKALKQNKYELEREKFLIQLEATIESLEGYHRIRKRM